MVGTEFFDVTIATDDHNEDSVSVEPRHLPVMWKLTRLLLKIMVKMY